MIYGQPLTRIVWTPTTSKAFVTLRIQKRFIILKRHVEAGSEFPLQVHKRVWRPLWLPTHSAGAGYIPGLNTLLAVGA